MTEHTTSGVFDALADSTRRDILIMLRGRSLAAGEIASRFPQQRPAISKHLGVLRRAGLVLEERRQQRRLYSLRTEGTEPVSALLTHLGGGVYDGPLDRNAADRIAPADRKTPGVPDHSFDMELD